MESKLLSVIVAAYNAESYLQECINSLIHQTYKNLEILIVDDGSTDLTGTICNDFAQKDNRIHVIHQQNGGLSNARNTALNALTGDYITIVDADDYVLPSAFEDAITQLELHKLDFISFGSFRCGQGGDGDGILHLSLEDKHIERLKHCLSTEGTIGWAVIYKKELWKEIRNPEGRIFEDSVVAYQIYDKAKRCGYINKNYYYYRKTATGICSSAIFKPHSRYDYILACQDRLNFAIQKNLCIPQARTALIKSVLSYLTSFYGMNAQKDTEYYHAIKILQEQKVLDYDKNLLNSKYTLFLKSFNKADFIHKLGAKLSLLGKKLKGR